MAHGDRHRDGINIDKARQRGRRLDSGRAEPQARIVRGNDGDRHRRGESDGDAEIVRHRRFLACRIVTRLRSRRLPAKHDGRSDRSSGSRSQRWRE